MAREYLANHPSVQLIYTAQCSLGHTVGTSAGGLANNGMTDAQRAVIRYDDPEYTMRLAYTSKT